MDKLKIGLVSLTISPDSQDGSAKFFRGIFNYLNSRGHDVKLITALWTHKLLEENVLQVNVLKRSYFWVPKFIQAVLKFIQTNHFDIIHCNGPKGTLPLLFKSNTKFISTIHDLGPLETDFSLIPIEKVLIKNVIQKASLITTCSSFIKKEIKYFYPQINEDRIYNLYSAIEDKFHPYPEEAKKLRETLDIPGKVLLYIGRITKYKGVEDLIQAYQIVKGEIDEVTLIIGGLPDFTMEKKYNSWKNKYKDIIFLGHVSEEEIPWYYSMADLFVTYSHAGEGFGLTPIEAIACGTPVLCSSLLAYREVLKDNAVFVRPRDPRKLAQGIINILKNDEKREDLIRNSKEFVKRYTWKAVGKKLEQVYTNFLNQ